jgi:hypothetical protein
MRRAVYVIALIAAWGLTFSAAWAQQQPDPELLKAKEFFSTAGIPGDNFNGFPIGEGYDPVVHEFDFTHQGRSHQLQTGLERAGYLHNRRQPPQQLDDQIL